MKRRFLLLFLLLMAIGGALWWTIRARRWALPYKDKFAQKDASGWITMGGNWQFSGTGVVNRSDEHGAKLVTGSKEWGDVAVDGDLKLIGHAGDVGLMVRVNDPEPGVDAYNGYYSGLRSDDNSLVIGRAEHGWTEGQPTEIRGGVIAGRWYHLHVVAVGCMIGAEATDIVTGARTYGLLQEKKCVHRGMIGLRSMVTGGGWRNISVKRASMTDLDLIKQKAPLIQQPRFVFRETNIGRVLGDSSDDFGSSIFTGGNALQSSTTIEGLKMHGAGSQENVTTRGVVTLLEPLYIQDSAGGISVEDASQKVLNLGDEVQVTGHLVGDDDKFSLVANDIHLTGDRVLVPPSSVTSTQAAGVLFDGRLAELRARLVRKEMDSEGRVRLLLEDAAQRFRAEGPRGLSGEQYDRLIPGSELRVRGVCRVGPWQGNEGGAFTILMRSMEDAEVVAGAPWWSARLLIRESVIFALLVGLGIYTYLKVERSKMRAILHERERLAHEMHDTLAQSFAGVGFHLQGVRNSVRTGTINVDDLLDKLTLACDLVTRTHRDASSEIAALHPGVDDGADLLTLLERCTLTMLEGNHLPLKLVREGTPHDISLAVRDALFHVGREAITNILRHAKASMITMRLLYEFRTLTFEVSDDGCGFDREKHANGFGLRGMQARCTAVGGSLQIVSNAGQGTYVRIQTPYRVQKTRTIMTNSLFRFWRRD